ncbi:hypothetical protein BVL54_19400 [Bacillus paralicheniformis]|nr:hypothetical protein BVL54_19400 [Bacillus paralicheniformis]
MAGFIYSASKSAKSANLILFTLIIAFTISFVKFLLNSQYYIQSARSLFYACHDLLQKTPPDGREIFFMRQTGKNSF